VVAVAAGLGFGCKTKQAVETAERKPEPSAEAKTERKLDPEIEASMKAFDNRKRYPALTPEILKGIPDDDLEQALIDFVDCKIEANSEREREVFAALSPGFRAVYATWILESEVNNGGFNQFFWNSSGEYAGAAAAGFDLLGTKDYARLMRRAIAIRDRERARMRRFEARNTIDAFSESYKGNPLNALDEQFYKLGTDLSAARIKFVRAKPQMFVGRCRGDP